MVSRKINIVFSTARNLKGDISGLQAGREITWAPKFAERISSLAEIFKDRPSSDGNAVSTTLRQFRDETFTHIIHVAASFSIDIYMRPSAIHSQIDCFCVKPAQEKFFSFFQFFTHIA